MSDRREHTEGSSLPPVRSRTRPAPDSASPPQSEPADGYKVGYRRPPREHQFRKGTSGNPRGRKKGSRNIRTIVQERMAQLLTMNLNNRQEQGNGWEAVVMRQMMLAIQKGDRHAVKFLMDYQEGDRADELALESPAEVSAEDAAIVDAMIRRLARSSDEGGQ